MWLGRPPMKSSARCKAVTPDAWHASAWKRSAKSCTVEVRVEGSVQKVSEEESEKYFHSRPRGSQLGAIVSKQSTVISGREVLQQAYKELEQKYSDGSFIPKPDYWGGYRLTPNLFEFWQGQQSRLHDRLQYSQRELGGSTEWHIQRLSP
ncbi:unnamed protein product [Triticum turgidum subsp. durum]|uniref:pyridoxal 5'-phosphate synthase n=1 Tax=Triticum turgidum subsp. durum TaxID=4567 RepID=A0A9R1B0W2_TRITD|nr:unnamed protein product [Triticum turgidum subsp. durum]